MTDAEKAAVYWDKKIYPEVWAGADLPVEAWALRKVQARLETSTQVTTAYRLEKRLEQARKASRVPTPEPGGGLHE